MCVAAVISTPVSLVDLKKMEDENPHGAGIAWLDRRGRLRFLRGITAEQIFALQKQALTFPYLLHFRWATHGDKIKALCHPFPVGHRALLGETKGTADKVVIHNGIWGDFEAWLPSIPPADIKIPSLSDTAIAAYFLASVPELAEHMSWAVATAEIHDGALHIERFGSTWAQHEGNMYSNLRWAADTFYGRYGMGGGWSSGEWGDFWARKRRVEAANKAKVVPLREALIEALDNSREASSDGDWADYVRARYGDEMVADLQESMASAEDNRAASEAREVREGDVDDMWDAQVDAFMQELEESQDVTSEDFTEVNAYLARKMVA